MQHPELEQFLGRGDEKIFWRLSLLNAGGAILGFLVGQRLGELGGLHGPVLIGFAALLGIAGVWATTKRKGVVRAQRTWLWLRWLVARQVKARVVDAGQFYAVVEEVRPQIRHRRGGATTLRSGTRSTRRVSSLNGKG
jgi:hypothetical protein